ncbi:hypothetical protein GQ44DRAFT_709363 [Phaeosphaeriaceae sp. PMI808]|nr:hypothetical protein GQ44DRAFT_709363 [Phaeosphaeriaceae sp. PMI808]
MKSFFVTITSAFYDFSPSSLFSLSSSSSLFLFSSLFAFLLSWAAVPDEIILDIVSFLIPTPPVAACSTTPLYSPDEWVSLLLLASAIVLLRATVVGYVGRERVGGE